MGKTVTKRVLAMPQASSGKEELGIELSEILATEILEFTPFEQIPALEYKRTGIQR